MTTKEIDKGKFYELALNSKFKAETERDEINKYYTTLFAAIITILPFINNLIMKSVEGEYNTKLVLIVLSLVGFFLSISWSLTLKVVDCRIKAIDLVLIKLEKEINMGFITSISGYMEQMGSSKRVTKQEMLMPYTFSIIFFAILAHSIIRILAFG